MSGSGAQGLCGHNIPVSMASAAYINLIKRICCEYEIYVHTYVAMYIEHTIHAIHTVPACAECLYISDHANLSNM